MINLSATVLSRSLNSTSFEVFRTTGAFVEGGWEEIPSDPVSFTMYGVVLQASARELQQVPEADRVVGTMMFWTKDELFTTRIGEFAGVSDKVLYADEMYRIQYVNSYKRYGFFSSMGTRIAGE